MVSHWGHVTRLKTCVNMKSETWQLECEECKYITKIHKEKGYKARRALTREANSMKPFFF